MTSDWADAIVTPAGAYRPFLPFPGWASASVPDTDWLELASQLDAQRHDADAAARRRVLDRALATAAFDTGAIEGLYDTDRGITETIAAASDVLAAAEAERGREVRGTFAGQLDGYQHLLDAVTESVPVTEVWLRGLHERLTAGQDSYAVLTQVGWQDHPLPRGAYKTQPNNVRQPDGTRHSYAPVEDTPAEMARLVDQLRSEPFLAAHPILQAAYAHHGLSAVHPFADGNGRVARALASLYLLRAAGVPLLVYADQKAGYLEALRAADTGRVQPLVDFVADRALELLALMALWLGAAGRRSVAEQVAELDASLRSHGGLGHAEVETAGRRALQRLRQAVDQRLEGQLPEPPWRVQLIWRVGQPPGNVVDLGDPEYRTLTDGTMFQILLMHDELSVQVVANVFVGVAKTASSRFTFRIVDTAHLGTPPLRLRLAEVYPELTAAATDRLDLWAEQLVHDLLAELHTDTDVALRGRGFK